MMFASFSPSSPVRWSASRPKPSTSANVANIAVTAMTTMIVSSVIVLSLSPMERTLALLSARCLAMDQKLAVNQE
jgi:mannitol-specific phosphotransferase system IIBC component